MAHRRLVSLLKPASILILGPAAILFAIIGIISTLLMFYPTAQSNAVSWSTFLLPMVAAVLVLVTMIVDLIVRQGIYASSDVSSPMTRGSFWLYVDRQLVMCTDHIRSTVAFAFALAWSGMAEYIRWQRLEEQHKEPDIEENGRSWIGNAIAAMSPWGRQNTAIEDRASTTSVKSL